MTVVSIFTFLNKQSIPPTLRPQTFGIITCSMCIAHRHFVVTGDWNGQHNKYHVINRIVIKSYQWILYCSWISLWDIILNFDYVIYMWYNIYYGSSFTIVDSKNKDLSLLTRSLRSLLSFNLKHYDENIFIFNTEMFDCTLWKCIMIIKHVCILDK